MTDQTYDGNSFANKDMKDLDSYPSGVHAIGERAETGSSTLIGRYIQDMQFYASQGSSPGSGDVSAVLKNNANVTIHTFWTKAATLLHATGDWTSFPSTTSTHKLVENDYFALETTASGNIAKCGRNNKTDGTDAFDTTNSTGVEYLPYATQGGRDTYFKMTYSTTIPSTGGGRLPPSPIVLGGL